MGRVVIRAIKAYLDGGGDWLDLHKLEQSARFGDETFGVLDGIGAVLDPLGYLADTAATAGETILLTSELLADILRLVHPDVHPPERLDLANRVTQQLLALQPFVFPAVPPKPFEPRRPPRDASSEDDEDPFSKLFHGRPRYPCAECASTVPMFYCTACCAEWEKRRREEHERQRANQRKWNAWRKGRRANSRQPSPCAACGKEVRGKRKDARFCSPACRQRAHRKAVTDNDLRTEKLTTSRDTARRPMISANPAKMPEVIAKLKVW
ncbi:MAG: hypothetical protein ACLQJR_20355 [Stellaceae bacterium]